MIPIYVISLLRVILGLLFTFSGAVKFFDLKQFAIIVASFGILPRKLVKPLSRAQPIIETFIGLWLLSNVQLRFAAIASLGLLLVATFFVAAALVMKKKIQNCGCYGALVQIPLTWKKLAENVFWIALATVLTLGAWAII